MGVAFYRIWENALKWTGSQGEGFSKNAVRYNFPKRKNINPEIIKSGKGSSF